MRACSVEGCNRPVWGKGFCQWHQHLRTDKKRPEKVFVAKARNHSSKLNFGFESQIELFNWLWDEAKNAKGIVICPFTGEKLNHFLKTDLWFNCFAHVLPKGQYTYFKLNPKNVMVVFPEFHRIVDQGTTVDRANHPTWKFDKWDQRKEELKIEYALFKKQNLLP